ncbi:hypothetical protein KC343_g6540 [Hortaea werneckii]|nr:hypothetical protein KC323_g5565 [Hortaea werneckii]KAI7247934.1 hypothetical protein KC352_g13588 [Hortaea werneckii]KAI7350990.1 hypothetical protein KC320_g5265 [Hortaea werneckii]KAI7564935.1 hypothetical protein KC317_g6715 [Hortaea werneckii]KAI7615625.1 hypothetical protein KC346_g6379 [Hortaea werneckii]
MTEKRRPTSLEERNPAINKTPRLKMDTPSGGNEFKAIQKKEVSDNRTRMFLSIDYGTKTLSVAFRFLRPNEIPNLTNVITLELSKNEQLQPQIVAWAADGTFHWGSELDSRVKSTDPDYSIPAEDVIDLWKLVLYQQHKDSDMGKRVLSKLKKAEKKLSELLTTHFSAIVAKSREALKRDVRVMLEFSDEQIDSMEIEVFISVPQMWKAPANRFMTQSAKDAGFKYVELVYEPHCAAAYYANNIMNTPSQLSKGDVLIIADIGGGTGDFVSYEFGGHGDDGAKMPLSIVGNPEGALCGSQFVNENFREWLLQSIGKEFGSFTALCAHLGRTEASVLDDAQRQFETLKRGFEEKKQIPGNIFVRGAQGAERRKWDVEISGKIMAAFFDKVIKSITNCIDYQIQRCPGKKRIKALIIPGGFGQSKYLMNCLESKYGRRFRVMGQMSTAVGRNEPVSRGALLRYADIETRGLSSNESFGVGRTETFDPRLHPDVANKAIPKLRRGVLPDLTKVKPDPFTGEMNVHQRWMPILTRGDGENPKKSFTFSTWREDWVQPDETTMTVQIYWTDSPNIAEHAPLMIDSRDRWEGKLDPRFEPWGRPQEKKLPDLKAMGFKLEESTEQGECYVVHSRLILDCKGANVELVWQIARPDSRLYDEDNRWDPPDDIELTDADVFELVDASFNPNPRTSAS